MLAVASAVGVSATFGAPMGGVLFSIEVTAQYFLVSLYWRCFFACVIGEALLHSWWHADEQFGINSMLKADDVSSDVTQAMPPRLLEVKSELLAYIVIGATCGLAGALFVKLNKKWMNFRKAHSHLLLFRNPFVWSSVFMVVFGLLTFPDSPFGHFMSKSQAESINELFNYTLSDDWHNPHLTIPIWSPNLGTLLLYIFFRFSFLVVVSSE
ncbi:MAG: hypothetical protein SGPRY_010238 [Prymnesium sp.]